MKKRYRIQDIFRAYNSPEVPEWIWISMYVITRHYGGPEEGGWWYNRYDHYCTMNIPNKMDQVIAAEDYFLSIAEKEELIEGDIYSSLGGQDVSIFLEEDPGRMQTTRRPHYE